MGMSVSGTFQIAREYYPVTRDTLSYIDLHSMNGPSGYLLRYHGNDTILLGDDVTDQIMETYIRVK
jgi:hypothetical protein